MTSALSESCSAVIGAFLACCDKQRPTGTGLFVDVAGNIGLLVVKQTMMGSRCARLLCSLCSQRRVVLLCTFLTATVFDGEMDTCAVLPQLGKSSP